ncbi:MULTISPECIES: hypothetical protein [Saccharothrix]|uniref:hypothetical protein n=1 Tax=Saccharothrix TaxID=2071 RepID=UPI00093E88DF|nr:hypothetical protein [Saccharothrix sp. CB00851]OKI33398.1 hypothetical protein A6A25_06440 [Saccharothrix sp. CB00851]
MDSALLDEWLAELVRRRWTFHYVPNRESPEAIAAVFRWRGVAVADVIVLIHEGYAWGYRVVLPTPGADPFRPEVLVYSCEDTAIRTIREVLTIPSPGHSAMPVLPAVVTESERALAGKFTARRCVIRPPQV